MISDSIVSTLVYSDHFGFPLTFSELHTRLVGVRLSKKSLMQILASMLNKKLIEKSGIYYHLPGKKSLVLRRESRRKLSETSLDLARNISQKLGVKPGVLSIYLTGSLAMQNSDKNSDIDLMIIARSHELWTTRLFLTIYTTLLGLRRLPGEKQHSGKLCLNLYLTPASWVIPKAKRSLYTAYELIQAIPLYDPLSLHSKLLSSNLWVKEYLPNFAFATTHSKAIANRPYLAGLFLRILEFISYQGQRLYMHSRITRELITPDSAFFHPHNPGVKVLKKII